MMAKGEKENFGRKSNGSFEEGEREREARKTT